MLGWMSHLWTSLVAGSRRKPSMLDTVSGADAHLVTPEFLRRAAASPPQNTPTYCSEGCPSSTASPPTPKSPASPAVRSYARSCQGARYAPGCLGEGVDKSWEGLMDYYRTRSPDGSGKRSAATPAPAPSAKPSSNTTSSGWETALLRDLATLQGLTASLSSLIQEQPTWFQGLSRTLESNMVARVQFLHRMSAQMLEHLQRG